MPVEVKLPTSFKKLTGGKKILEVKPGSLNSVLMEIITEYPDLKKKLLDEEGNIKKFIIVFLNEEKLEFPEDLDKEVRNKDRLLILPALSGG